MTDYRYIILLLLSMSWFTLARPSTNTTIIKKDTSSTFNTWARKIRYKSSFSSVTIENRQWTRMSLKPDLPFGHFGIALDLELFLDNAWTLNDKGYQFGSRKETLESLTRKLYYVRYNNPGDDIYLKAGGLEYVTLGYGFLVNNYSNSLEFPEVKRLGVQCEANSLGRYDITIQSFINNVGEIYVWGPLLGVRTALKAFKPHTDAATIIHTLEIGVTGAADFNQNQGVGPVASKYTEKTCTNGFYIMSAEATLPIMKNPGMHLALYGEAARSFDDRDFGTTANGFGFSFPGMLLTTKSVRINGNFCYFKDRFCSEYFNVLYEFERHRKIGLEPFVKDEFIDSVNHFGISAKLTWDILGVIHFRGSGQFLFGDSLAYDRLGITIGLGSRILNCARAFTGSRLKVLSVDLFYHKNRIGGFDRNALKRRLFPDNPAYLPPDQDSYFDVTPFTLFGLSSKIELAKWFGMNVRITRQFQLEGHTGDVIQSDRINVEPYLKF